jgi:hypothetical protein
MAEVSGDFGGTPITLNNAATEATLKQLVAAIGILSAKSGKDIKSQKQLDAELKKFYKNLEKSDKTLKKLNQAQEEEAKKRKALADALNLEEEKRRRAAVATEMSVAGVRNFTAAVENTVSKMTGMMSSLAGMGNSFSGAASAFSSIPLVGGLLGTVFGAIASSGDRVFNSFREAASVGANFNGSIRDMIQGASEAGLTIEQFAGIIKRNGENVALLGTGTQDGARQLAKLGKIMKASPIGDDLARLGYNTEEISEGMAKFGGMMAKTGKQLDQGDLVKMSGEYLKNLTAMSELTGKSKDALQAESDARMADSQYRLMLARMDAEGAKNFELLMQSVPKAHQAGLKEIITTGTANSDAAKATMAFMNQTGQSALALGQTMRQTGTLTKDQFFAFDATRRAEAKANMEDAKAGRGVITTIGNFGTSLEQDIAVGMMDVAAQSGNAQDALEKQNQMLADKAKKDKDALDPAAMKKFQENIAELSNKFTTFLAQNMPLLMSAFDKLTSLVTNTLLPAFNFLMDHFTAIVVGLVAFKVVLGAAALAMKAIEMHKALTGPGTNPMRPMFVKDVSGGLGGGDAGGKGGKGGKGKFGKIGNYVKGAGALGAVVGAGMLVSDLSDISEQEKDGKITAAEAKEQKGGAVGGAVGGAGGAMAGAAAGAAIGSVVPVLGTAIGGIVGGIVGGYLGRTGGQAAGKSVMAETKTKAKAAEKTVAASTAAATPADTRVAMNYSAGSESLLKQFAKQENSPMVKEAQQKVEQAEAARKEIEAKAQTEAKAKQAAEEKAAAEKAKIEKEKENKSKAPTQESAESLLASLNTRMAELIKINKGTHDVNEQQLSVQRGLTSDLFAA